MRDFRPVNQKLSKQAFYTKACKKCKHKSKQCLVSTLKKGQLLTDRRFIPAPGGSFPNLALNALGKSAVRCCKPALCVSQPVPRRFNLVTPSS
jgi:hypothetical protein